MSDGRNITKEHSEVGKIDMQHLWDETGTTSRHQSEVHQHLLDWRTLSHTGVVLLCRLSVLGLKENLRLLREDMSCPLLDAAFLWCTWFDLNKWLSWVRSEPCVPVVCGPNPYGPLELRSNHNLIIIISTCGRIHAGWSHLDLQLLSTEDKCLFCRIGTTYLLCKVLSLMRFCEAREWICD